MRQVLTAEEYIEAATKHINGKRDKEAVAEELRAHIEDKRYYYLDLGYDEIAASQMAVGEMGEPDETSATFSQLYKNGRFSILILLSFLFCLIYLYFAFFHRFSFAYGSENNAAKLSFGMMYSLTTAPARTLFCDLISLGFTAGFIIIPFLALKYKKKLPLVFCFTALLLSLIFCSFHTAPSYLDLNTGSALEYTDYAYFYMFQPVFNLVISIFSKGFDGYINGFFTLSHITGNDRIWYNALSAVLFSVLLLLSVSAYIIVLRQEHMKSTKRVFRICNISIKAFGAILLCQAVIMSVCSVFSIARQPEIQSEKYTKLKNMVDYVVNFDSSRGDNPSPESCGLNYISEASKIMKRYAFDNFSGLIEINQDAAGYRELHGINYYSFDENDYISYDDIKKVLNKEHNLNLYEFLNYGFYYNATSIQNEESFLFSFEMKTDDGINEYAVIFNDYEELSEVREIKYKNNGEIISINAFPEGEGEK